VVVPAQASRSLERRERMNNWQHFTTLWKKFVSLGWYDGEDT